jgi:hypothetical protein
MVWTAITISTTRAEANRSNERTAGEWGGWNPRRGGRADTIRLAAKKSARIVSWPKRPKIDVAGVVRGG